jgi:hypothetical protein
MTSLAHQLPSGLQTENEILNEGFKIMKAEMGSKTARYYFYYHEDFPSDLINKYLWIQKELVN